MNASSPIASVSALIARPADSSGAWALLHKETMRFIKVHLQTILAPVITEKSTKLSEHNQVVFKVPGTATKPQIKKAVEELFKVKVKAVNTTVVHGKNKRAGRFEFKRSNWKKAIITLAPGQKIELFQVKQ